MPRNAITAITAPNLLPWVISVLLLILAAALYLLDPVIQHFERIPFFAVLRDVLTPYNGAVPVVLHHHFADFAWAVTAAVFANCLLGTVWHGVRMVILLIAASSWEWLQGAGVAPGVFDPRDVLVSAVAAMLVWRFHVTHSEPRIEPAVVPVGALVENRK
jgi:hypothetical protein